MEFILSEKSKPLIPMDGYKFCFHKMLANDIQRWTCSKSSCKCYLKINCYNKIIESNTNHNHDKIEENISNRQALSNSLKRKAVEDVFAKSSKLIRRELKHGDVSTLTNDLSLIWHNIHRTRCTIHPPLPKSTIETHSI